MPSQCDVVAYDQMVDEKFLGDGSGITNKTAPLDSGEMFVEFVVSP